MSSVTVTKRGLERLASGHPWIYRSDVIAPEGTQAGAVRILDQKRRLYGQALYSTKSQIALRFLTREDGPIDEKFFAEKILAAEAARKPLVNGAEACRMVNSEGDLLPSLVIDRYGNCLSLQTLSEGMELFKPTIVEILKSSFAPRSIIERNDASVRALEGLPELKGILAGDDVHEVVIQENGVKLCYDLIGGQKTGGFLDQRENRAAAATYAQGRALDCFTYTGGFALTVAPKCESVLAIDSSSDALRQGQLSQSLNEFNNIEWREANCFDFLKAADTEKQRFDFIVLDPPAFARQKSNLDAALRGYKELNLRAMKILNPGGYLVTCSCSFHVSEADLLGVVAEAALDSHRTAVVVERRTQSRDHPILLTVPETHYLKCLILRVF
jgi:23S rRNA (cytosine1962-C5)-methyltransferase